MASAEDKDVRDLKKVTDRINKKLSDFERGDASKGIGQLAFASFIGGIGAGAESAARAKQAYDSLNNRERTAVSKAILDQGMKRGGIGGKGLDFQARERISQVSSSSAKKALKALSSSKKMALVSAGLFTASMGLGSLAKKIKAKREEKRKKLIQKETKKAGSLIKRLNKSKLSDRQRTGFGDSLIALNRDVGGFGLSKSDYQKVDPGGRAWREAVSKPSINVKKIDKFPRMTDKDRKVAGELMRRFPKGGKAMTGKAAVDAYKAGAKGRWVTIQGRKIFIRGESKKG